MDCGWIAVLPILCINGFTPSSGKASADATMELGPVLAVKAVDGQLKVPITNRVR